MAKSNDPTEVFQHIDMRGWDECWPWLGTWGGRARDKRPYWMCQGRRTMSYRWVWELVNGPIPDGLLILHSCDQGGHPIGCNNIRHMRLGTVYENSQDMVARERHGLPKTVVRAILTLLKRGTTQQDIADLYGIARESVSAIATGRSHKSVPRGAAARIDLPSNDLPSEDSSAARIDDHSNEANPRGQDDLEHNN